MCAALLPLASCGLLDDDKEITPSGDDNYVSVSVSDVRDGYFKLDFECGEGTQTIEYAVCRAVNMKTDSVAFKAGDLDGVQRIELSDLLRAFGFRTIYGICPCGLFNGRGVRSGQGSGLRPHHRCHSGVRKQSNLQIKGILSWRWIYCQYVQRF